MLSYDVLWLALCFEGLELQLELDFHLFSMVCFISIRM